MSFNKKNFALEVTSLNNKILEESYFKYDLRTFLDSQKDSFTPFNYINDGTRKDILAVMNMIEKNSEAYHILKNQVIRDILYFGSECEHLGAIQIEKEYKELKEIINSPFLTFQRTPNSTIDSLLQKWDEIMPEVIFFSCHGSEVELFLKDDQNKCKSYGNIDFIKFFQKRVNYTECVILSSCQSLKLAEHISDFGKNVIAINNKVSIDTAHNFNKKFFQYLNRHSLDYSKVFREAYDYSSEIIQFKGLQDSFAFEFLEAKQIS